MRHSWPEGCSTQAWKTTSGTTPRSAFAFCWRPSGLNLFLRRQFPDKSPRDFGGLAVVVVDEEAGPTPILNLQVVELCPRRDLVGLADRGVRFENAEAVLEFHVKGVLPAQVADVLDFREPGGGKRHFGVSG